MANPIWDFVKSEMKMIFITGFQCNLKHHLLVQMFLKVLRLQSSSSASNLLSKRPPSLSCEVPVIRQEVILSSLDQLGWKKASVKYIHISINAKKTTFTPFQIHQVMCSTKLQQPENHDVCEPPIGVWLLAFQEDAGRFCPLCKLHDTLTNWNKDYTRNSKLWVRMVTGAIQLHYNSDMQHSAIEKDHFKRMSPFRKGHKSRNEVLKKSSCSFTGWQRKRVPPQVSYPF